MNKVKMKLAKILIWLLGKMASETKVLYIAIADKAEYLPGSKMKRVPHSTVYEFHFIENKFQSIIPMEELEKLLDESDVGNIN